MPATVTTLGAACVATLNVAAMAMAAVPMARRHRWERDVSMANVLVEVG
jgi:hypothetical protein